MGAFRVPQFGTNNVVETTIIWYGSLGPQTISTPIATDAEGGVINIDENFYYDLSGGAEAYSERTDGTAYRRMNALETVFDYDGANRWKTARNWQFTQDRVFRTNI